MKSILVTGVGGRVGGVGTKVVNYLRERGQPVRALTRTRNESVERLSGVEVVVGDLTSLDDVHRALDGVSRVYLGLSVSPQYLEATTNVAAVARERGLEVLVNMSQLTVSGMSVRETTDSPQQKLHWLSEQVLNWSGLPVVHVRPTVFLDNPLFAIWAAESIRAGQPIQLPFGAGKTSPVASSDVARVVGEILVNPTNHVGSVYELTGPASLSMDELAREYSEALGREVRYVDVAPELWLGELGARGLPPHVESHLKTMARLHRDNEYDRFSTDVRKVTGRDATSLAEWVRERQELFT